MINCKYEWWETIVSFPNIQENGIPAVTTEHHLLDEPSFSAAEERITKEMLPYIHNGDMTIKDIKRRKYEAVIGDGHYDFWYSIKGSYVFPDDKNDREKTYKSLFLVNAHTLQEACDIFIKAANTGMIEYSIIECKLTEIHEIYR